LNGAAALQYRCLAFRGPGATPLYSASPRRAPGGSRPLARWRSDNA